MNKPVLELGSRSVLEDLVECGVKCKVNLNTLKVELVDNGKHGCSERVSLDDEVDTTSECVGDVDNDNTQDK